MGNSENSLDPAAVFASALSLWQAVKEDAAKPPAVNLSECYNGGDEFMRQVMRVATEFEGWSCAHVVFEELDDVWPYRLEDAFGDACVSVMGGAGTLMNFDERDCLSVAWQLRLPIKSDSGLPVPLSIAAPNPVADAAFCEFRIQTVRHRLEDDLEEWFTFDDEPFDEEWSAPYFSLYGVEADGRLEDLADRGTYTAAVVLARKLAPGIAFPPHPFSYGR